MARYLLNESNGRVLPWTAQLHKRSDMRLIDQAEADAAQATLTAEQIEGARLITEGEEPPPAPDPGMPIKVNADGILAITDKAELEAIGRSHGIELDKRKAVKTLQGELIEALGLS